MLKTFLQIYLSTRQKKKISKTELLTRGQTITNGGITTGKELLQPQNLILF